MHLFAKDWTVIFIKRMTANSNHYARLNMNTSGELGGEKWSNITVWEMNCFYGVILEMSICNREQGRYAAYYTENTSVNLYRAYSVVQKDYPA